MIWHLHNFGKWEDVQIADKAEPTIIPRLIFVRQTIKQQRRCSTCNLVQSRYSA